MAVEVFKLFGSIFVNNDEANKSISATDKKASGVASTLGNGIKTAAKWGTAIVGGAAAAVGGLSAAAEGTREYRTEMGKLETAFTTSGFSGEAAKKTYKDLFAVLGDESQSVEAANHLSKLCDTEEELKSWTDICTGVFATFGDSLPIEGLTEAANETAKVGQVTGPLADALNWVGVSEDKFNESLAKCSTEQERQQLITSTLSGLYSEASEAYKENNKDIMDANSAQATLSETTAKLGAIAEPVFNKITGVLANLLTALMPLIENFANQLAPLLINFIDQILPVFLSFIEQIAPAIGAILPAILELFSALGPLIAQLIEQLLPPLINIIQELLPPLVDIITALIPLIQTIFELIMPFISLILQLIEPIAKLISEAIAPLVEKFATLLNELLKPLIPIFNQIVSIIVESLSPVFEALQSVFEKLTAALSPIFDVLSTLLSAILPALVPIITAVADVFGNVLGVAIDFVSGMIDNVMGVFGGLIDFITGVFTGNWEQAWDGIVAIFKNIINMVPTVLEFVINGAIGIINGICDGINAVTGLVGIPAIPDIPQVQLPRFRAGIDLVPYDKFPAYLDAGEAVLNAQEAEQYRQSKQNGLNPFTSNTEQKAVNNNISITIEKVEVKSDQDINALATKLSAMLAAEISKKGGVFG